MLFKIHNSTTIKSSPKLLRDSSEKCRKDYFHSYEVVNKFSALTGRLHFGSPFPMEELLRSEGVKFDKKGNVRIDKHM